MDRVYYYHLDDKTSAPDEESMAAYLLDEGVLWCSCGESNTGEPTIVLYVLVNDHFVPAADGEGVTLDELPRLYEAYKAEGWNGVYKFVAQKRGISHLSWRELRDNQKQT